MLDNLRIYICERLCTDVTEEGRIIPVLGPILEQRGPVAKTPQFHKPLARDRRLLLMFEMSSSQFTTLRPKFVDKKGNPANVDGKPEWFTDNTDVLALEPSEDGLTCKVSAVGPLGSASVTMKADADMGDGVQELFGTLSVLVNAGQAATVVLDADPPQEQPEPQ